MCYHLILSTRPRCWILPEQNNPTPLILLLVVSTQAHSLYQRECSDNSSSTSIWLNHLALFTPLSTIVVALHKLSQGEHNTPHYIQSIGGGNNHKEPLNNSPQAPRQRNKKSPITKIT